MKIYRIQSREGNNLGLWNSDLYYDYRNALQIKINDIESKSKGRLSCLHEEITELESYLWGIREINDELHAPHPSEYNEVLNEIPKESKFFFKESFFEQYYEVLTDIVKRMELAELVVYDLDQVEKFEMFYQDDDQVFVNIIKGDKIIF